MSLNNKAVTRIQLMSTSVPQVQIKRMVSQNEAFSQQGASSSAAATSGTSTLTQASLMMVDTSTQLSPVITSYKTIPQLNEHRLQVNETKQPIVIGKYTLHEQQACDSFNTAICNQDNTQYYWKVFKIEIK